MSLPIAPINSLISPGSFAASVLPSSNNEGAFQNVLKSAIDNVETSSKQADAAVKDYMSGKTQELHSAVLATQNADLDFEMFMQVRNKVVSAYEEIMRMQV